MNIHSRVRSIVDGWIQHREAIKRLKLEKILTYAIMKDAVDLYMKGDITHEAFGKMLEGKLLIGETLAVILDEIKKATAQVHTP